MIDADHVIATKLEATYGVDAAPTLAANAIATIGFQNMPVEIDSEDRGLDSQKRGATKRRATNERSTSSYGAQLAGTGTAGDVPPWMLILQACGMAAPAVAAGVSATQKFAQVGDPKGSLTQYHWVGDQLRKVIGQRGTFSLDFSAGNLPVMQMEMLGLVPLNQRSVAAPGAADFSAWLEPVEVNDANSLFTLDGYGAVTRSLQVTAGKNVNLRSLIGARYINSGNHAATAQVVVEAPSVADKDYFSNLQAGDLIPWQLVHGTAGGNIIQLDSAKSQITAISESEEDDILMYTIDLLLTVDGGADDLVITAK